MHRSYWLLLRHFRFRIFPPKFLLEIRNRLSSAVISHQSRRPTWTGICPLLNDATPSSEPPLTSNFSELLGLRNFSSLLGEVGVGWYPAPLLKMLSSNERRRGLSNIGDSRPFAAEISFVTSGSNAAAFCRTLYQVSSSCCDSTPKMCFRLELQSSITN
ncbi:hypothetical protein DPMN_130432 [Dreissena polymorpha]|uniref:Uncharacterized protein n=1 Tax=Dreissena polymorpha TaxID=45954 RepID=A0A9D4H2X5_DREPO|nr:hypothetical protein DPMN_130432 [Dreissena polymorpha]